MKLWVKHLLKIASCMTGLGIVIALAALASGAKLSVAYANGGVMVVDTSYHEERISEANLGAFHTLRVDTRSNITVKEGAQYGVDLVSYVSDTSLARLEYDLTDGVLTISESSNAHFINLISTGYVSTKTNNATVHIPSGAVLELVDLRSDYGTIKATHLNCTQLSISNSYGNLDIQGVTADTANIQMQNGSINLSDLHARILSCSNQYGRTVLSNSSSYRYETLDLSAQNGAMGLTGMIAEDMSVENRYGKVDMNSVQCENLTIEMHNGRIIAKDSSASTTNIENMYGDVKLSQWTSQELKATLHNGSFQLDGVVVNHTDIENEYGNVKLQYLAPADNYTIGITTEYGSIKVNGEAYTSNYSQEGPSDARIMVKASSGTTTLSFQP